MGDLSKKELTALEELLKVEQNLAEKYKMFADTCEDVQLRTKCQQISARHQNHYQRLWQHLEQR